MFDDQTSKAKTPAVLAIPFVADTTDAMLTLNEFSKILRNFENIHASRYQYALAGNPGEHRPTSVANKQGTPPMPRVNGNKRPAIRAST
ncbi:hypothetical protein KOR42_20770 [Thalassoglobus neptunius]|uniref:Uncharacterized protein n=1 Tax=Thalassoglobus neptunius TaxID=1938619 RepID=A0A5C5X966_9PLAN|nr:hypothetical protein KOR42_20770 [Thalassoglobus neptunius]